MNAKEDPPCFSLRKTRVRNENADDKKWEEKKGESLELSDLRSSQSKYPFQQ